MKDTEDVQRLLRLKRYETPGEEYFKQFAEDLKERQRAELLKGSARTLLAERITLWVDEISPGRWAVPTAAAACAALLTGGLFFTLQGGAEKTNPNSMAEAGAAPVAKPLPDFSASADEVIELSLPKPATRVPGGLGQGNENVLTAGIGRGFREL